MGRESRKRRARGGSRGALEALGAVLVLASALGTGGCAATPFVKATDSFASATTASMDALAPSFGAAASVCRMRARLHFLANRGLGDNDTDWTAWYAGHKIARTEHTWKDHCEALKSSDEMLKKALVAVGAYAQALKSLADTGSYDGESLKSTTADAGALGLLLAQNQTSTQSITNKVKDLARPIGAIGEQLIRGYAAKELRGSIREAAPDVAVLLGALKAYNEAVTATFTDADSLLNNAINVANSSLVFEDYGRAEARAREVEEWAKRVAQDPKATADEQKRAATEMRLAAEDAQEAFDYMTKKPPTPPAEHRVWRRRRPDAMKVLDLDAFASRHEREISAVRAQWAALGATLTALDKANGALLSAANGKLTDEEAQRLVAGLANDVIVQITALKKVAEQGRSEQ